MTGVLMLVAARARHRPARWLLPALGIALAVAFAGSVWVQSEVAATQAARQALAAAGPRDRTVEVSWMGPVTDVARSQARQAFAAAGLGPPTEVVLLGPVRLDGRLVRVAGLAPLGAWATPASVARCAAATCRVLLAGGPLPVRTLSTEGARLDIVGSTHLRSAIPLGFVPEPGTDQPPLLLTGDVRGLDVLPGLGGLYRSHDWVGELSIARLSSWDLHATEQRLARAQAQLLATSSQFTVTAPFAALDAARAAAATVGSRLLPTGGGAVAALLLFIVLSAAGLRRDQSEALARLAISGSRAWHGWLFVAAEVLWLSALATLCGALIAIGVGAILAHAASVSAGGALRHSLLSPLGAVTVGGAWLACAALLGGLLGLRSRALADGLAIAAAAALALALAQGASNSGSLALALVPLASLAAGVVVFRAAGFVLAGGERLARKGPPLARLAFVGLARAPTVPALAVAFVALSTGLGGFALVYHATLTRGASDQAAQQVPLDALVAPSLAFVRPLALEPLSGWQTLTGGTVAPVRRTEATFVSGGASVTVPALGVPASVLPRLHGWRAGGASAPIAALARRLVPRGPTRTPGPQLGPKARVLSLRISSPALDVSVNAELRAPDGSLTELPLGASTPRGHQLTARVPRGRWEMQALELSEPTGLDLTDAHQNGEDVAANTQVLAPLTLGPLSVIGPDNRRLATVGLGTWATTQPAWVLAGRGAALRIAFSESGLVAVVRPPQPGDTRPVPVLADPGTSAAAGRGGRLTLEVDGVPVTARVVGVLTRFPTVAIGSAGFVVADEATLASALEAQMPGQGTPDELWLAARHLGRLRAALAGGRLAQLTTTFAADLSHGLRDAPVARAVLGTLLGAAALSGVLALIGLLVAVLGALRDDRLEDDLLAQGLGVRALRRELRLRVLFAGFIGVAAGLVLGLALAHLAVVVVRAAGAVSAPQPPLIAVSPLALVLVWAAASLAAVAGASWLAALGGRRP